MKPIMFKFNNDRQEEYRTQTIIYDDMNGRTVWKNGLTLGAQKHIEHMCENQQLLQQIYPECTFCTSTKTKEGVRFDFLEGECYSDRYECAIKKEDKDLFVYLLRKQAEIILSCVDSNKGIFKETQQYTEIFGDGSAFEGQAALNVANFEFTSHNMLLNETYGLCGVIDYEYVFCFPIPIDLLLYHCVVKTNIWTIKEFDKILPAQEMLDVLGILTPLEKLEDAWSMFDKHFGRSKIGEAKIRYLKENISIVELEKKTLDMRQEIIGNKNYIGLLTGNLEKQQNYIKALTDNLKEQEKCIEVQKLDINQKYNALIDLQQKNMNVEMQLYQKNAECLHLQAIKKLYEEKIQKSKEQIDSIEQKLQIQMHESTNILQLQQLEIDKKRRELENLQGAFCWKITAPLRKLIDRVRRVNR